MDSHSATSQDQTLAPLKQMVSLASLLHPALKGEIGSHTAGQVQAGQNNLEAIKQIYDYWYSQHPEAGSAYWAVRTWSMLCWQPAYLAVAAVHGSHTLPALESLSQKQDQGAVMGYCLTEARFTQGPPNVLIPKAGESLRLICQGLLEDLTCLASIRPMLAWRLLADRVLLALKELHRLNAGISNQEIMKLGEQWLEATDLVSHSALMTVQTDDGEEILALDRKSCCLHYLRHDGAPCSTCPKQPMCIRLARLRGESTR